MDETCAIMNIIHNYYMYVLHVRMYIAIYSNDTESCASTKGIINYSVRYFPETMHFLIKEPKFLKFFAEILYLQATQLNIKGGLRICNA